MQRGKLQRHLRNEGDDVCLYVAVLHEFRRGLLEQLRLRRNFIALKSACRAVIVAFRRCRASGRLVAFQPRTLRGNDTNDGAARGVFTFAAAWLRETSKRVLRQKRFSHSFVCGKQYGTGRCKRHGSRCRRRARQASIRFHNAFDREFGARRSRFAGCAVRALRSTAHTVRSGRLQWRLCSHVSSAIKTF